MKLLQKSIFMLCCGLAPAYAIAGVPGPMKDVNQVVDNTLDSLNLARTVRPVPGSSRVGSNPVLFLVGNSTMRTGTLGNGNNGQWGWGYFMNEYFDPAKITVENHALGGMSSRTFYNVLWNDVKEGIRPGDWVIIELGHNDNGPYDSGRARASIPGIGNDSLNVTIKETGKKETVYTYGEYMRRFVREVKAKGGKPILMSLTPRNAWDDKDSTKVTRVNKTFGLWAKQVAEAEKIPFIDLNEISARKFEKFGKEKVKQQMFYIDRIHTSAFGARNNVESAVEGIRNTPGLELAEYLIPQPVDNVTGSSRKPGCPVVFTIGDSTVKNEDKSDDSMWGWGSVIAEQFDTTRITVENHAKAGRSARTFLDEGRWDKVYNALQPGDFVIMQFGHNDGGDINVGKARGELWGSGDESKVFKMEKDGKFQVVYTYGWYIRKFVLDCLEKGATPIILSHTPRNKWTNGKIESNANSYGKWAKDIAIRTGVDFIDLNRISGEKLQELGEGNTAPYFKKDHTHASKLGARMNAQSIADGLRATNNPLKAYLKEKKHDYDMSAMTPYSSMQGYGYDFGTKPDGKSPFFFSVNVPDGNYKVTVTLGDKKKPSSTVVRAEQRRLMADRTDLKKGKFKEISFIVNKRNKAVTLRDSVKINPREVGRPSWDDKLTLEFNGEAPAVSHITIEPAGEDVTTVFLCGNSTVVDQAYEPWASWGQMIPVFFDNSISIANNAESGQRTTSFIASRRLDKVLSMAKKGDYILIEFGHNDEKDRGPGSGAYYNFTTNLKRFIDEANARGLHPVLLTPTARRKFDSNGKNINTHGDYVDAVRRVGERENVPVIELTDMSTTLYETLGEEGSKKALVHYPAGSFPGQDKALADNTHFNTYGAYQIAKCVAEGLKKAAPELAVHLVNFSGYNPAQPDDFETFYWPNSPFSETTKPYGN
jgi:lysophospholipase L1-like esterase